MKKKPMTKKKKNAIKYYRRKNSVPRPKTFGFNRTIENLLDLHSPSTASGFTTTLDGQVVRTFSFALSELPNYTEFANLFNMYKLNYAVVKMFPSYGEINRNASTTSAITQSNIIVSIWENSTGTPLSNTFTRQDLNEVSRKRQFMFPGNKPLTCKMPLSQLSNRYASTVNTDYAKVRPRYISTGEPSTSHYGINIAISRVDNQSFGSDSLKLLVKEKVYLTTKQVQ